MTSINYTQYSLCFLFTHTRDARVSVRFVTILCSARREILAYLKLTQHRNNCSRVMSVAQCCDAHGYGKSYGDNNDNDDDNGGDDDNGDDDGGGTQPEWMICDNRMNPNSARSICCARIPSMYLFLLYFTIQHVSIQSVPVDCLYGTLRLGFRRPASDKGMVHCDDVSFVFGNSRRFKFARSFCNGRAGESFGREGVG